MSLLRRFLVLAALMFWQGGFTFYAAVVVPIGQQVLNSPAEQGFITRQVTWYLNVAGLVALGLLAWDVVVSRDAGIQRRCWRWLAWAGMLATLGLLVWLHPRLDELLDPESWNIRDRIRFRAGHRWYLWVSTVQWAFAGIYTVVTLGAWRAEDWSKTAVAAKDLPEQKKCPAADYSGVAQSPKSSLSGTTE